MKKIGIITIVKNAVDESFGPAMQIFAVQEVIRSYGFEPETIVDETCKRNLIQQVLRGLDEIKKGPESISYIWRKAVSHSPAKASYGTNDIQKKLIQARRENYAKFIDRYIKISTLKETDLFLDNKKLDSYSYFAVGSDQVWNPYYPQVDRIKYLQFCDKDKRVAFVPSIAQSDIPFRFRKNFIEGVNGFNKLCIREEEGKKLIRKYAKTDAEVLIDPTMMIPTEKYAEMAVCPKCMPEGEYAFCYFLGTSIDKDSIEKSAKCLAEKFMWMRKFDLPDYYIMNPSEYLYAIKSAKVILTDSFHVTVFAIMFHKPVIVFHKKEGTFAATESRLTTLLKRFNMLNCFADNGSVLSIPEVDYDFVDETLNSERINAKKYFDEIFLEG